MMTTATAAAGTIDIRGGLFTLSATGSALATTAAITAAAAQSLIIFTFTVPYLVTVSGYYYMGFKVASATGANPTWLKSPSLGSTLSGIGQSNANTSSGSFRVAAALSQAGAMPANLSGYTSDTMMFWMGAF